MDVDAGEHRIGGGRRGSHAPSAGRRNAGAGTATDRGPVMLYTIGKPKAPASNVFQLNTIRSYTHGLVTAPPLGCPLPLQLAWRERLRQANKPD